MKHEQILEFWGHSLQKIPLSILEQGELPHKTRVLLTEVGLPVDDRLNEPGLRIVLYPREAKFITYDGKNYFDFGKIKLDFEGGPNSVFCIRCKSGTIYIFDKDGMDKRPPSFVNTSIEEYLQFLGLCTVYGPKLSELGRKWDDLVHRRVTREQAMKTHVNVVEDYKATLEKLRYEFAEIDPAALCGMDDCYWSELLFDWSL